MDNIINTQNIGPEIVKCEKCGAKIIIEEDETAPKNYSETRRGYLCKNCTNDILKTQMTLF